MSQILLNLLGTLIFTVGLTIVLLRKNFLFILMGLEIMLNGVNLLLVGFTRITSSLDGQALALLVLAIGASEVGVGLGIALSIVRRREDLDVEGGGR
jgi:NADH-quinone oxidoreductase subunit K